MTESTFRLTPREIDLVCYDFDGVMTDNRVLVFEDGREGVFVNRADGWAVASFKRMGLPQLILSTEENPVVSARGDKLGIPVLQGISDKRAALEAYAADNAYDLQRIVYVGNDINDLEAMEIVGIPIAPADGDEKVRRIARHTTRARGGDGVVRELYEIVNQKEEGVGDG